MICVFLPSFRRRPESNIPLETSWTAVFTGVTTKNNFFTTSLPIPGEGFVVRLRREPGRMLSRTIKVKRFKALLMLVPLFRCQTAILNGIIFFATLYARSMQSSHGAGAPGVTRTPGAGIRNPLLYPPELRGHISTIHRISTIFLSIPHSSGKHRGRGDSSRHSILLTCPEGLRQDIFPALLYFRFAKGQSRPSLVQAQLGFISDLEFPSSSSP